jgi:glycosyltransferase involved in cell wall biosynthesis
MKPLSQSLNREIYDVAYLTTDSIQEGVGTSQIVPLLHGLVKLGNTVALVSFEKKTPDQTLLSQIANLGIEWKPLKFGKNGAIHGFLRLLRLRSSIPEAKVIHARSDIPAVAALLRNKTAPVVWDVRSLWGSQRGIIKTKGWNFVTIFLAEVLEKIAAHRAHALVTLTENVVPVLLKRHKRIPKLRAVIPTSVQLDKFVVSEKGPRDKVCLLSGTYNDFYDLDRMTSLLNTLNEYLDFKVVWARPDESTSQPLVFVEIEVLSPNYDEMPMLISDSSFSVLVLKDQNREVLSAVAPTKIAEFLACGRPILINSGVGDLDLQITKYGAGVVLDYSKNIRDQLKDFVRIIDDPQTAGNCRRLAVDLYSMEMAISNYQKIYQEALV